MCVRMPHWPVVALFLANSLSWVLSAWVVQVVPFHGPIAGSLNVCENATMLKVSRGFVSWLARC